MMGEGSEGAWVLTWRSRSSFSCVRCSTCRREEGEKAETAKERENDAARGLSV